MICWSTPGFLGYFECSKFTKQIYAFLHLLVVGVNDALRLAAWLTAGGGGGIVGGVDLGWVLTSAGESGIVPAFCPVLPTNCIKQFYSFRTLPFSTFQK